MHVSCVPTYFFFFSSRRRHTRSLCDWSSDVCSSDLWNRLFVLLENATLVAETIHFHAALSVDAHENIVVLAFQAVLAYHIALMKVREQIGRASCRERV